MVDPLDPGTMAMAFTFKRGRGRPRKTDALSAAERARRYRARRKQLGLNTVPASLYEFVVQERDQARAAMESLHAELEQLRQMLTR